MPGSRPSASEVHAGLKRLSCSGLVVTSDRPVLDAVEEFFVHAVKYIFPAKRGEITRGLPTSYAAPPIDRLVTSGSELPPVWPFPEGDRRGVTLEPLYSTVPAAALRDSNLYELLALLDAVRAGRARERRLAAKALALKVRRAHE